MTILTDDDEILLTEDEKRFMARLTDILVDGLSCELDVRWPEARLIAEDTLFYLGGLIRDSDQPITVPWLGTFRRHPMVVLGTGRPGALVSFQPDPLLFEDAL